MTLREVCASARVSRHAGGHSFERGEEYAATGRVRLSSLGERSAVATVAGTSDYRVALRLGRDDRLEGACSCPIGAQGAFCKHCVAVALVQR